MSKLSDLLLSSGFGSPRDMDAEERTMQALHDAILDALFNGGVLPEETIVHTGHGDSTTIGAERPHLQEWVDRGW